jgi:receptor protein-tyrosine kinase
MSKQLEPHFRSSLFPVDYEVDLELDVAEGEEAGTSTKRSIGAIFVDAGILTQEQAYAVMEVQREKKIRFGEAAVQMGLISEGDIRYALSFQYQYNYLPKASGKHINEELIAAYNPFGHEVDLLRAIRSQLMLRWFDKSEGRSVLSVLSAGRAEGASYLAANLAIVFAQMGEKTLLIDADMRAPRQHSMFELNNQLGFSSLLAGRSDVASVIQTIPFMQNLHVIPAGPVPPNPLELLNRDNLAELMQWAGETYDIVLVDNASLSSGADGLIIAGHTRAALTVACTNQTRSKAFLEMIEELKRSQIGIVGSVLNNPPLIDVTK